MNTLERLLARIGALRARWKARSRLAGTTASSELDDDRVTVGADRSGAHQGHLGSSICANTSARGRLRKLSKICGGLCALVVGALVALASRETLAGPRYPNATLSFSRIGRGEFAHARLQDSQSSQDLVSGADEISLRPRGLRLVNKKERTAIEIEWIYFGSSRTGDSYEFKVTGPSGATTYKHAFVMNQPIYLLRDADFVISIVDRNIK